MKFCLSLAALVAASTSLVAAAPAPAAAAAEDDGCLQKRIHVHHQHKRAIVYKTVTEIVDANNKVILLAATEAAASSVSAATTQTVSASVAEPIVSFENANPKVSSANAAAGSQEISTTTSAAASASTSPSSSSSSSSSSSVLDDYVAPTEKFVDGVIPCSSFPQQQGVVALDHLGFGGWSGIYNTDTSTGGSCKEGSYCSYACQSGMSKTQWPSSQPDNGVSVGGLLCKNGYLVRSNTDTDYLCEWGVDSAYVQSELSESVAICRTDYPGTENMVIPTVVEAGGSSTITVVNQETYWKTQSGDKTSAQYYVNNAGISWTDGCVWGTEGSGLGNWAPLNFGAGYDSGISYLSLIKNPNNLDAANFNVQLVGATGSTTVGSCEYNNGVYTNDSGDNEDGCTLSVTSGRGVFILKN